MIHAALVLAQHRATLTVGDRTELRARIVETATGTVRPVMDLFTSPNATLNLNDRRFAHSLSYAPRLTLRGDALPGDNPELLHGGSVQTSWRARRVFVALTESASYGLRNFSDLSAPVTLATPLPPGGQVVGTHRSLVPLQALPATRSINWGSTSTSLSSVVVPERRWTIATRASFFMSGGTDSVSQIFLPVQRGASFDAGVTHALTRSDQIITSVTPSAVYIPRAICELQPLPTDPPSAPITCSRAAHLLDVSEGWTKRWSRQTTSSLFGGVTVRRIRLDQGTPFRATVAPLAGADLTQRFGRTLFTATSRLGTVVDQRSGIPETRMSHGLAADWRHFLHALRASAQYTQTVGASAANTLRLIYADATATRRLSSRFDADTGVRMTWQENQGSSTIITNVYVGIVYHEPRILF